MKPIISILLGSGFSIPEGLPGVKQLNQRLSQINEADILIHTSYKAIFLNGQEDVNRWMNQHSRFFVQEFLEFYNEHILNVGEEFNYETFFDFYSGYIHDGENKDSIEKFYKTFNEKHFKDTENHRDCLNMVIDFDRTYQQLLASSLQSLKYFQDISWSNYPKYDDFIGFLLKAIKRYDVKVHSLNHDLFFDWLGHHRSNLFLHFTDGFELAGSPFYGDVIFDLNHNKEIVHKNYTIKLEHFTNRFNKPVCLFKLHGSIFNIIVYLPASNRNVVRIKTNYSVGMYKMEVESPNGAGEYKFEHLLDQVQPDFLSGTKNKRRYYLNDPYYRILFDHFEKNLIDSDLLFVIGYGFQDEGINEYLEKHFLSQGKQMIVIDPCKPKTGLIDNYKAVHIAKSIIDVSIDEYLAYVEDVSSPSNPYD